MGNVIFVTEDKVEIAGNLYTPQNLSLKQSRSVLLLHMMPSTKESFSGFAEKLKDSNYFVLAIDLRGHGESINQDGIILDSNVFEHKDHQKSIKDIKAAVSFMRKKNIPPFAIVGASIGANLALWYQSSDSLISKTVLLSGGLDYRGIIAEPLVKKLESHQEVFFIGGEKDMRSGEKTAGEVARILYDATVTAGKKIEVLNTSAHGTDMFLTDPLLEGRIISWIES